MIFWTINTRYLLQSLHISQLLEIWIFRPCSIQVFIYRPNSFLLQKKNYTSSAQITSLRFSNFRASRASFSSFRYCFQFKIFFPSTIESSPYSLQLSKPSIIGSLPLLFLILLKSKHVVALGDTLLVISPRLSFGIGFFAEFISAGSSFLIWSSFNTSNWGCVDEFEWLGCKETRSESCRGAINLSSSIGDQLFWRLLWNETRVKALLAPFNLWVH